MLRNKLRHMLRSLLLQPVFVMQPAEHRRRCDAVPDGELVSVRAGRDLGMGWFRNSWPQRGVWAASVVMDLELSHDPPQMPFVDRNQEVETLAADGPDQTLAVGIRR